MKRGYNVNQHIDILTEDQVERIHLGTLEVLEETGVVFDHEEALKILKGIGCEVDPKRRLAKFPSHLVEKTIRECPSSFHWRARDRKKDLRIDTRTLCFFPFSGLYLTDLAGKYRRLTMQEFADTAKVIDALDEYHANYHGAGLGGGKIEGIPEFSLEAAPIAIRNMTKPYLTACFYQNEVFRIRMAQVTNQNFLSFISTAPALTIGNNAIWNLLHCAEVGFPLIITSGLSYGGNSPATIAGSLVLENAEILATMVLAQTVKPGLGVIAHHYAQPMNMRTGQSAWGAIEGNISYLGFAQIWRSYGIPTSNKVETGSKLPDYQAAMDCASGLVLSALAGCNLVQFGGNLYDELMWSPVKLVMDNDLCGMVGRILEGFDVTDRTLAIDLIKDVGPIPGTYIDKEHTRISWKKEQFMPTLADRLSYEEWVKGGSKDMVARAKERYEELLTTYEPTPLPEDQSKELDKIVEEAREYYKKLGLYTGLIS